MDEVTYYVRRQGRVEGPWSISKLRSEIALRKLGRHHELSADGSNWKRASEVDGLFSTTLGKTRTDRAITQSAASDGSRTSTEAEDLEVQLTPIADTDEPAVWYCIVGGAQTGPLTIGQLVAAVQQGRVPLEANVWREGFADWQAVRDTREIMGQLDDSWRYTRASGAATQAIAVARRSPYAGYALWLGIGCLLFSWVPLIGLAGFVPLFLGTLTIRDVRRSEAQLDGTGAAIAGVVFGLISIAIAVVEITIIGFIFWNNTQS